MEEPKKNWKEWLIKSYHPIPTANTTIGLFLFLSFLLLLLGIIIQVINGKIIEKSINYDKLCSMKNPVCTIKMEITQKMEQPIFLFYELDNFYQNHRRYLKSKSLSQLAGDSIDYTNAEKNCDPIIKNKDLYVTISWKSKKKLNPEEIASPCGLIAKSFFNDTYRLFDNKNKNIIINETDITWPNDKGSKFKRGYKSEDTQWIDPEDEHFINWMRPAGLPLFRKLWGRIEVDLEIGNYTFIIQNNYNVNIFEGSKSIVLSTSGAFGGKNSFLGVTYIVIGVVCFVIALIFYFKKKITGGKFGAYKKEN